MWREYEWPDGGCVLIKRPQALRVSPSGAHYVLDGDGISHCILPSWRHLTWKAKDGCPYFDF